MPALEAPQPFLRSFDLYWSIEATKMDVVIVTILTGGSLLAIFPSISMATLDSLRLAAQGGHLSAHIPGRSW